VLLNVAAIYACCPHVLPPQHPPVLLCTTAPLVLLHFTQQNKQHHTRMCSPSAPMYCTPTSRHSAPQYHRSHSSRESSPTMSLPHHLTASTVPPPAAPPPHPPLSTQQ
jgi:hypothetical protein